MPRNLSLFFLFLLFTISPYSQQNKTKPDYRQLYVYAEKLFHSPDANERTDSLALRTYLKVISLLTGDKNYNEILTDSYLKSGILEMSKNQQELALSYFHQAILINSKNTRLPDSLLFMPYLYAGSIHYTLNDLDSAVYYYKKAEAINTAYGSLKESERLFNKFGALYYETGDYNKSISYFEKALSIVERNSPSNIFFIINYKNNIATALMKLAKYQQALDIFKDLLKYGNPGDELLYNTGNTYFENNDYAKALEYIRRIRKMNFEKFGGLMKIFLRLGQYDSAAFYLEQAENFYVKNPDQASKLTHGVILKYSGDLKAATGRSSEALRDYQSAIINLDPSFKDESISANPSSFSGLQNFLFLFDALVAKASLLNRMAGKGGGQLLEQSLNAYESSMSLASHIEKTYFSDDSRLFLKKKVNPATSGAVNVAIGLYNKTSDKKYLNAAFGFAENNKATVLQAGLKNLELSSIRDMASSLVLEEKKLRTLLARLSIQSALTGDSALQIEIQGKIHDAEISLATVQDKMDENPSYHELKFYRSSVTMDSLQKKLKGNDEAILSYYYTDSNLLCFYITKDGSGFSSVPLHENLFSTIISLRKELQNPQASGRKYLQYAGSLLYQTLIEPVFEKIKNRNRLIVIPYSEIGYIPFEMLVNPADGSLLVKRFAISYNYSVHFLSDKQREKEDSYRVLALAPFADRGNADLVLPALNSSGDEINNLPGKILTGAEASKKQFVTLSGQFPILHLATHAVANDTNLLGSYIEFYGLKKDADTSHRLYEQEIYTLDLKSASLVILSACETGNGMLVNGEGVMSLSRAFSYAGCKSVVTSLWKADELSTTYICKRFHHYLKKGVPIDEALQKAKNDYLETNEIDERYKNPAYWAHLILIGGTSPVLQSGPGWYLILLAILAVALAAFIILKKARHKNMPG